MSKSLRVQLLNVFHQVRTVFVKFVWPLVLQSVQSLSFVPAAVKKSRSLDFISKYRYVFCVHLNSLYLLLSICIVVLTYSVCYNVVRELRWIIKMMMLVGITFEIVVPNEVVIRATATENSELFAAIPWSHGTRGFLTRAEIEIVPALPYVHLTYNPCHSLDTTISTFSEGSSCSHLDLVEGLQYSKECSVVMIGKMVTKKQADSFNQSSRPVVNSIGRYYKPWLFENVRTFFTKKNWSLATSPLLITWPHCIKGAITNLKLMRITN